ncbi:DnaB-like helicase C-terminal domain-containing protein [Novacetimonas hansenii]|uniref:DnaB-like helicase C-terminal domain-containing protein n=1 Tax=Novacetimonas hansenii TaxID=436 RepID=UPI00094F55A9|nr:DnaB-like helicase C-terminal domain-containing protein [Novacetimonas hansenii]
MNGPDGLFGTSLRQPPTNIEAEQALLGALLTNNGVLSRVEEILEPEHFYIPIHGAVYGAARKMVWDGGRADPVTLRPKFEGDLRLRPDETALQMLMRLAGCMVGIAYAAEYATTIRSAWFRRNLFEVCSETADLCCRPGELPDSAVMEGLENRITRIATGSIAAQPTIQIGAAIGQAITGAREAAERGDGLAGITWGYRALDRMTGGLHRGDLTILGARAGAAWAGLSTLSVFTGRRYDIPPHADTSQREPLAPYQWRELEDGELAAASLPMQIDHRSGITVAELRTQARAMRRSRQGLDLIVVDYVGLLSASSDTRSFNLTHRMTEISKDLKNLAGELEIPVLALAQLSRESAKREDKRPELTDLRDSGSLEQDAATVLFLHRDHYYLNKQLGDGNIPRNDRETDEAYSNRCANLIQRTRDSRGKASVYVAKNRHGATGACALQFQDMTTWFRDVDESDHGPAWTVASGDTP